MCCKILKWKVFFLFVFLRTGKFQPIQHSTIQKLLFHADLKPVAPSKFESYLQNRKTPRWSQLRVKRVVVGKQKNQMAANLFIKKPESGCVFLQWWGLTVSVGYLFMLLMHVSHIHLYKAVAPYRTGVCVFDRTVQTLDSSSEYLPALSEAVTTLSYSSKSTSQTATDKRSKSMLITEWGIRMKPYMAWALCDHNRATRDAFLCLKALNVICAS